MLLFIGAPLALAAVRFEVDWLFTVAVGLLLVALAVPARRGQTPLEKVRTIFSHLPGIGWRRRGSSDDSPEDRDSA